MPHRHIPTILIKISNIYQLNSGLRKEVCFEHFLKKGIDGENLILTCKEFHRFGAYLDSILLRHMGETLL